MKQNCQNYEDSNFQELPFMDLYFQELPDLDKYFYDIRL